MAKWEYKSLDMNSFVSRHRAMEYLEKVGQEKWELVSVDNGIAYFKRPINEMSSEVNKTAFEARVLTIIRENLVDCISTTSIPLDEVGEKLEFEREDRF